MYCITTPWGIWLQNFIIQECVVWLQGFNVYQCLYKIRESVKTFVLLSGDLEHLTSNDNDNSFMSALNRIVLTVKCRAVQCPTKHCIEVSACRQVWRPCHLNSSGVWIKSSEFWPTENRLVFPCKAPVKYFQMKPIKVKWLNHHRYNQQFGT